MASIRSPLHARTIDRRTIPSGRRGRSSSIGRGLLLLLAWVSAGTAVLIAATWVFAAALHARANIRSSMAFGSSSIQLAHLGLSGGGIPPQGVFIASLSPPETQAAVEPMTAPDVVAEAAVASVVSPMQVVSADPAITGSLGIAAMPAPASLAPEIAAVDSRTGVLPLPLPRARPKLASLQPPTDMIKPSEDARSPRTAIYDITAQIVYLPNGERLEAHSGYGNMMDNPRYVHVRMRGATPPNTYKLTLRESLFHGVQAIRMTPVGESNMFGRAGILAHTYMLGATGQSNGCVSFRNYPRFLQAFLRGEVDRMVVVSRLDRAPTFVARRENTRGDENAL
jgi:hypothetical protein